MRTTIPTSGKIAVRVTCNGARLDFFPDEKPTRHWHVYMLEKEIAWIAKGTPIPIVFHDGNTVVSVTGSTLQVMRHDGGLLNEDQAFEAEGRLILVDTQRLAKVLMRRIEIARKQLAELKAQRYVVGVTCKKEARIENFELDRARFAVNRPNRVVRGVLGVMQILGAFESYARPYLATSIASFAKSLSPSEWQRLRERLSATVLDGGQLRGCGRDEIGFRHHGLIGSHILRGAEFSSHT